MAYFRDGDSSGRGRGGRSRNRQTDGNRIDSEAKSTESSFLKSLVETGAKVTVVLKTGETLHGRIRYYDRNMFSLRQSEGGPNIFLRKDSVLYIGEAENLE